MQESGHSGGASSCPKFGEDDEDEISGAVIGGIIGGIVGFILVAILLYCIVKKREKCCNKDDKKKSESRGSLN